MIRKQFAITIHNDWGQLWQRDMFLCFPLNSWAQRYLPFHSFKKLGQYVKKFKVTKIYIR